MILIEAADKLLNYFQRNESFSFIDNYKELMTGHISLTADADRAATEISLRDLEKNGLIKSFEIKNNTFWILTKPFSTYDKTLVLSYSACLIISEIARQYAEQFNNKDLLIDTANITEKDILKVLGTLIQTVKNQTEQVNQENNDNISNN